MNKHFVVTVEPKVVSLLNVNNKYGYQVNVNHPKIKPYYARFKRWKGVPDHFPLTDEQRKEFENFIFPKIRPT